MQAGTYLPNGGDLLTFSLVGNFSFANFWRFLGETVSGMPSLDVARVDGLLWCFLKHIIEKLGNSSTGFSRPLDYWKGRNFSRARQLWRLKESKELGLLITVRRLQCQSGLTTSRTFSLHISPQLRRWPWKEQICWLDMKEFIKTVRGWSYWWHNSGLNADAPSSQL